MNLLFLCLGVGVEDYFPAAIVIGEGGADDYRADNNASENNSATSASLPALKTILDCKMIVKGHKTIGQPYWLCLHCNDCSPNGHNATRALFHVLGIRRRQHIKRCTAVIPPMYLQQYEALYLKKKGDKKIKTAMALS